MCDFRVTVGDHLGRPVHLVLAEDLNAGTEGHEGVVDASSLAEPLSTRLGPAVAFRAGQIDE